MSFISESAPVAATERLIAIDQLPGPKALPFVGNAFQIKPSRLHLQLEAWARTYGDMYRLQVGKQQIVVISRTEDIAAVLRARPDTWIRPANFASIAREDGACGLFAAEGEGWGRQRPMG